MTRPLWRHRFGLLLVCASTLATPARAQARPAPRPKHLMILVDRSVSRTPQQMTDMRAVVDRLAQQLDFGDALSVVEVMQDGNSHVRQLRDSIPGGLVPGQPTRKETLIRDALRQSFRGAARKYTDTTGMGAITSTDLLATIRRVSDYTSPSRRQYLVILSDMLQSTKAQSFERASTVPGTTWIAAQRRDPMFPQLSGVCTVAVGVDDRPGRAARVREFWMRYFQTAGAILPDRNYRMSMDDAQVGCE